MSDWRATTDYRLWRVAVIRRDSRCVICNSLKGRNAHHINSGAYFPKLRFNVDNGITLCRDCHTQFHCNFKNSFKEKCTEKDWNNFLELVKYLKEVLC
jgi:hypothetical protein